MSLTSTIYWTPTWVIGLVFLALLFISFELGYRTGRRKNQDVKALESSDLGTIQASVLGLLGLLLAFTYSFAASRYDNRKFLLIEDANAIGTAYLRAKLLPEPYSKEMRVLLANYADARVIPDDVYMNAEKRRDVLEKFDTMHGQIWEATRKATTAHAPTVLDALMVQSINEVIDIHGKRYAAFKDRVPVVILGMLFIVSMFALGLTGYNCGLSKNRNPFFSFTLCFLVVGVFTVILDLDRPRRGLIQVNQENMVHLRDHLKRDVGS